jgi:hypothetical protein
MRYSISQGLLRHPLEVEIEGVPPCLFCGEPVTSPSMDGPLVCGACDCGRNRGGSKWTEAEAEERYAHRRSKVAEYRVQMIDRRAHEAKELLAKMTQPLWNARGTYIETAACLADVCDSDDAAFMAIARKLLPDLIERDALRGEEVAKWAHESGTAKGALDVLLHEVTELRALAKEKLDRGITIDNQPLLAASLRASIRAALKKLQPGGIRELRELIDDPRRSCGGANQADYERAVLPTLLAMLPDLLAAYEEVAKLAPEEPFVSYPLAKGGPWP